MGGESVGGESVDMGGYPLGLGLDHYQTHHYERIVYRNVVVFLYMFIFLYIVAAA
jgi:hypothetical protein